MLLPGLACLGRRAELMPHTVSPLPWLHARRGRGHWGGIQCLQTQISLSNVLDFLQREVPMCSVTGEIVPGLASEIRHHRVFGVKMTPANTHNPEGFQSPKTPMAQSSNAFWSVIPNCTD